MIEKRQTAMNRGRTLLDHFSLFALLPFMDGTKSEKSLLFGLIIHICGDFICSLKINVLFELSISSHTVGFIIKSMKNIVLCFQSVFFNDF